MQTCIVANVNTRFLINNLRIDRYTEIVFLHFPDGDDVNIMYAFLNNKLFHIFQMNVTRATCMM